MRPSCSCRMAEPEVLPLLIEALKNRIEGGRLTARKRAACGFSAGSRSSRRSKMRRILWPLLLGLCALGLAPAAHAWGCKGHQVVALIAEKHLSAHARAMVAEILAAGPISPDLRRFCGESGLDAFADSSTWADDERTIRPETAGWHFIDIPRGAAKGDICAVLPARNRLRHERDYRAIGRASQSGRECPGAGRRAAVRYSLHRRSAPAVARDDE